MDDSSNKVIPFASVKVYQNDSLIRETVSDSIGNYFLKNLKIGKYDVLCEKKHFRGNIVCGVLIVVDKFSFVNFKLRQHPKSSCGDSAIDTTFYKAPLVSKGYPSHGR